ncbi:OmpA family protein [Bacteroidales bacterium OttesenSCG-928-M11]|nr:OmpA family protein [Bacteroidales bacterium OttesenSCG-928-M11]
MKAKIRVSGKDQNRIALGIINAYVKINPDITLEELQKAFPASLNPVGTIKEIVTSVSQANKYTKDFFLKANELIQLKSGNKVAVKYLWSKEHYHAIVERAKELGIEVKNIGETEPFEKGYYKLEMLEENTKSGLVIGEVIVIDEIAPGVEEVKVVEIEETPAKKKETGTSWLWWILALLVLLLLLFGWKRCEDKKLVKEEPVTIEVIESETLPFYDLKLASAKIDVNGDLIYDKSGKLIDIIIDGDTLKADSYATEAEVYNFLLSNENESGWIILDQVHFKFNELNFTPQALEQIKHITSILKKWDFNAKIEIEGFSDHIGTEAENQLVSEERARFTANHFVNNGFPESRIISVVGLKDSKRLCAADDTPTCRALNRRAEIRIIK